MLDSRCFEALLLKGASLLELKKDEEAILHYREALRLMPNRYEAYKGMYITWLVLLSYCHW